MALNGASIISVSKMEDDPGGANGLLHGYKWGVDTLTYSFPVSEAEYLQGGYTSFTDFQAFTDFQQLAVDRIFGQIGDYVGVTFQKTLEAGAHIRFAEVDTVERTAGDVDGVAFAGASYPDPNNPSFTVGDAFFNRTTFDFPEAGAYAHNTFMHEIGHALGLKHGQDKETTHGEEFFPLPPERNGYEFSIMTYRHVPETDAGGGRDLPTTFMQDDIAALQYLYGADFTTRSGDSRYTWSPSTGRWMVNGVEPSQQSLARNMILQTVWDGGGNDTYDFSNYGTQKLVVDLRPGAWTSVSDLAANSQRAFLAESGTTKYLARGNIANALLYEGDERSLIENAVGADGADKLTGNDADNVLEGGGGADTIDGGAGRDTASYRGSDAGVDIDLSRLGTRAPSGGDAQGDVLTSIENLIGSAHNDRFVAAQVNGEGSEIEGLAGNDSIFGSDVADTLRGGSGADYIYANDGNDRIYGGEGNLIVNGGFEVVSADFAPGADGYGIYPGRLDGWTTPAGSSFELFTTGNAEDPTVGRYGLDMQGAAQNTNIEFSQVVTRAVDGEHYRLAFNVRKLPDATARLEVYWGGEKLNWTLDGVTNSYIDPQTGTFTYWVDLVGGAGSGDTENRLTFKEIGGASDAHGTLIDAIRMYRAEPGIPKAGDGDPLDDGNDTIFAGLGNDVVFGDGGNDRATFSDLGNGNDHYDGGAGSDLLTLDWSTATSVVTYLDVGTIDSAEIGMAAAYKRESTGIGDPADFLFFKEVERFNISSGNGNDVLQGGLLADTLNGGAGNDTLRGGGGSDVLNGGEGFDRAVLTLAGGNNTIVLRNAAGSGSVTLSNGTVLTSIENVSLESGNGNDFLDVRGTVANNPATLSSDPAYNNVSTYFDGRGGDDTLAIDLATSKNAVYEGGIGTDLLIMDWSDADNDVFRDENGYYKSFWYTQTTTNHSTIQLFHTAAFTGVERFDLLGGSRNDRLYGGALDDILRTQAGRDILEAGAGNDLLVVDWSGINRAVGSRKTSGADDTYTGSLEEGYSGFLFGDNFTDYNRVDFTGIERFDIRTGNRNDSIRTGDGNDTVLSGEGDDHIRSGKGIDSVEGGLGNDRWEADKSFANETQQINVDLSLPSGLQSSYLGSGRVYGIEALTLKTGAAGDTIRTAGTVLGFTSTFGFDDVLDTGAGIDSVTLTGGRDSVAMGAGSDTLTVNWSQINRSVGTADTNGAFGIPSGSLQAGYAGAFYGDNRTDYNRVDFSGVEHFRIDTGNGNDFLATGDGNDRVVSGGGNDHIVSGKGIDTIDGGSQVGAGGDRWEADKSFAVVGQDFSITLTSPGFQSLYFDGGSVRGIEMLSLKTGDGNDTIRTLGTVTTDTTLHGFNDFVDTGKGTDNVTVTGGRDTVTMGDGFDTLTIDWSLINRNIGSRTTGGGDSPFAGSKELGYSGFLFGSNFTDYNRVDFSGVERFNIRTGGGHDLVRAGDGNDTISTGLGNDHLLTLEGTDVIDGGGGNDRWEADKAFMGQDQAMILDLQATGIQATYLGTATVRGIEMLTLKTGDGNDVIHTATNLTGDTTFHGFNDTLDTGKGNDQVTVTGGRDSVAMGDGIDTLVVDWSLINRDISSRKVGGANDPLTGSLAEGYSGFYFGSNSTDYNRLDFSGVEHFNIRTGNGNDQIRTGDGNDTVLSGAGNDHLLTQAGIDTIDGGAGLDRWEADKGFMNSAQAMNLDLQAGDIQATYLGATVRGIDMVSLKTGEGQDAIRTAATVLENTATFGHDDYINTSGGNDQVTVSGGRDTVLMGDGLDTLFVDWSLIKRNVGSRTPSNADSPLTGSLAEGYSGFYFGDNTTDYNRIDFSGVERFNVRTGIGNDVVRTGDGDDTVSGGAGNDHLVTQAGIDFVDGGEGLDRWEANKAFMGASQAMVLDLQSAGVQGTYLGANVSGIEMLTLKTGAGNDTILTRGTVTTDATFHGFFDVLDTGDGADAVTVTGGRDSVAMGAGSDVLTIDWSLINRSIGSRMTSGADSPFAGSLAEGYSGFLYGSNFTDYNRVDFSGVERFDIRTGEGHDLVRAGDGNDTISTGLGDDHILTLAGIDVIDGGGGNDRWEADKAFMGADEAMVLDLQAAGVQATYLGGATVRGIEILSLKTGAGNDVIRTATNLTGNTQNHGFDDILDTGAGNDEVTVTGGRDTVALGAGSDTLIVDWSLINRAIGSRNTAGGDAPLDGSLAEGYSGFFYGDNFTDYNRLNFSGVERFDIRTGNGGDLLRTGDGDDTLSSGAGNDTLITRAGVDVIDGGAGLDRWDADKAFMSATEIMEIDLQATGDIQATYLGGATVRGIEMLSLKTGAGNDIIRTGATNQADTQFFGFNDGLDTGAGDDRVTVAGGRDSVAMGNGSDTLVIDWSLTNRSVGSRNADGGDAPPSGSLAVGYAGFLFGSNTTDYNRVDFSGVEHFDIRTGSGHDMVRSGDGNDSVSGGAGNDHLFTQAGIDVIDGGEGLDRWEADKSFMDTTQAMVLDLQAAGVQATYLSGATVRGIEMVTLKTGGGNDVIRTAATNTADTQHFGFFDVLDTGAGNDRVTVTGGRDIAAMGDGADTLVVDWSLTNRAVRGSISGSAETGFSGHLWGSNPTDYNRIDFSGVETFHLRLGSAADSVATGGGNDTLDGGGGVDTLAGGAGDDLYLTDGTDILVEQADEGTDTVQSSATLILGANLENLILTGTEAINGTGNGLANAIIGNTGANSLSGGDGADTLFGGGGLDTLVGGLGDDLYLVDGDYTIIEAGNEGTDTVRANLTLTLGANVENLVLHGEAAVDGTGNASSNAITGNSNANLLSGLGGADTLDGGGGTDTLVGGLGNDVYVTDGGDTITEAADEGTDTVRSSATVTLGANLENLVLTGTAAINGTGNASANTITGNLAANSLNGGDGADTLNGGGGSDTLAGGLGADAHVGGDGIDYARYDDANHGNLVINLADASLNTGAAAGDTYLGIEGVIGGAGSDMITGDALQNILFGAAGSDVLRGGDGNDTLSGDAGFDTLAGGDGADELNGGAGIDYAAYDDANWGNLLIRLDNAALNTGAAAGDRYISIEGIIGGLGNDTIYGAEALDTLLGGGGDDVLFGGAGNDSLVGGDGGDRLAGGAGADRLVGGGGAGIDYASYEDANWGNLVISMADASLNSGAAAGDTYSTIEGIIGGRGNDTIIGDANRNYLYGRGGNDTIDGGLGNDSLSGQVGADSFRFTTALSKTNVDTINDFVLGEDKILLSRAIFDGIGETLDANEFGVAGASTLIVYNQATGQLSYDAGGSGSGASAVLFAKVAAGTVLDTNDFLMIA